MNPTPRFTVRHADWNADRAALRAIREEVFVREQAVPVELEWDGFDPHCRHVLAESKSVPIGTGRLLPDGHIGRMAVLRRWRGLGVGSALLEALVQVARNCGMTEVLLHAQTHALAFYARHGFQPEGAEFSEAGIAHRRMRRTL